MYLDENNLCRLNPVKPDKCRSFPFEWTNPDSSVICPELVSAGGRRNVLDRINMIDRIKKEQDGSDYAKEIYVGRI